MGDRSNIVVMQDNNQSVWLYGHWMGEDAIGIVGEVLSRKQRWTDAPYLTRMIFEKMIEGSIDKETGFGISTMMQDNEYPIIILNPMKEEAWIEEYIWGKGESRVITPVVSFEHMANACTVASSYEQLSVLMGSKLVAA
jgi:hypothetical protein